MIIITDTLVSLKFTLSECSYWH